MITAEEFNARLANGEKIEASDEMTPEYRESLINLMLQQADSELAGAYGYIPWIEKAPTIHEKLLVAQIVKDEIRHAYAMFKLLAELGIDVEQHIASQNYSFRVHESDADLGTERKAKDNRVNIFYYTIDTWTDFIMFNFTMDRGAGHQLEDAMESSYAPWARTIKQIFQEEMMHVNHGDTWVKRLASNPDTLEEVQEALDKWYPRVMNIFGRPNARKNVLYRQLGLKQRDNEDVRQAFKTDIEAKIIATGLKMPEWTPDYDESV